MLVRKRLEELEIKTLSPYAMLSSKTKGRAKEEKECEIRPAFQLDRDRIIHSKAFRRLKDKTQVFLSPTGDHYRTRLTHTLEVSQIARTIAKGLMLNESLTEAIALGHDLGHTPFGHAGEEVLNEISSSGFNHAEQSLRVVDILEKDHKGLNLTYEVRDGIVKHSKGKGEILPIKREEKAITLEGQIVRIADIIAYINHDIDDAIRGGIISNSDIPGSVVKILGKTYGERIDTMVKGVIYSTLDNGGKVISINKDIHNSMFMLRDFLYEKVYDCSIVHNDFLKAAKIIKELYRFFIKNPEKFLKITGKKDFYDTEERVVIDFIAGMTDRYAFNLYEQIFLPHPWIIL